jgi:hypothetical protein
VFGYGGAGIMFVTESGYLSYVAASDEAGRQLEEAQASAGQGPCYESYVYAREVVSSDVHADSRWPDLGPGPERPARAGDQPSGLARGGQQLPCCLREGAGHGRLPEFRRVSADRTFGGGDLWHIGFASGMGWSRRDVSLFCVA